MKSLLYTFAFILIGHASIAQDSANRVVLIGEDEVAYESAISECPSLLLTVTENSMEKAYQLWTDMFAILEKEAETAGVDLKGVKMWINLFWEADGSIKKIAYYPKPNSKNMDFDLVTKVLNDFSDHYIVPIQHEECFSHYGSISFPVLTKLSIKNEK